MHPILILPNYTRLYGKIEHRSKLYRVSQKKVDSNKYFVIFVARAIFLKVCMLVANIMARKKIKTATIFDV